MKILLIALVLTVSTSAWGASCMNNAKIAAVMQANRQMGGSLPVLVKQINHVYDTKRDRLIAIAIAINAYKIPVYSTTRYKRQAVKQFTNRMYRLCLEGQFNDK